MNATPELARSIKCPPENVLLYWPRIRMCMEALNVASEPSQIATLATIAVETMWQFLPIKELGSRDYFITMYDVTSSNPHRAQFAKENGNDEPGDGPKYPGRGFPQITWKPAYLKYGTLVGVDLVADPDRALDPDISASIFAAMWRDKGCQALADQGDFRHVRIRWNGGTNGMVDYLTCVERLKEFLPTTETSA